jgi:hypothetical protein
MSEHGRTCANCGHGEDNHWRGTPEGWMHCGISDCKCGNFLITKPCVQTLEGKICGVSEGVIWSDLIGWVCPGCEHRLARISQD